MNQKWKDVFPALAVPFNEELAVDEENYRDYIDWLCGFDMIKGLVVNGHTGEITSLLPEERAMVTRIAADQVGKENLIVSGVSAEGTLEAIKHAQAAEDAGADAILLMPPHSWLRFGMKDETPVHFFRQVAENIGIKIIIHLYPKSTKAFYPAETVLKIAQIPNVVALKSGTREMATFEKDLRIFREEMPELKILSCHDEYLLLTMLVAGGVDGVLVGLAGGIPELVTSLWEAVCADDIARCRRIQDRIFPVVHAVYGLGQPSGEAHARLKYMLYLRGKFNSPQMRPPVQPLTEDEKKMVETALEKSHVD